MRCWCKSFLDTILFLLNSFNLGIGTELSSKITQHLSQMQISVLVRFKLADSSWSAETPFCSLLLFSKCCVVLLAAMCSAEMLWLSLTIRCFSKLSSGRYRVPNLSGWNYGERSALWCIFIKFFCLCNDLLHPLTGKALWLIDWNKPHLTGKARLGGKKKQLMHLQEL